VLYNNYSVLKTVQMVIKITEGTLLRFKSKEVGKAGIEGFL
jgi:hypothetical protein